MFLTFFDQLRAAKVPVTLKEYLTLMQALEADCANRNVENFYYLARTTLVKDERHIDRFDQVFGYVFKGLEALSEAAELEAEIPQDWLRRMSELYLTDEEKQHIEALGGWEKIMEELKKRLQEQHGRHEGGNKWIGTGGTSPFGAYGYNPAGIRIGQKTSRHQRAIKVWDKREFKDLAGDVELGVRNIKMALRRLRKFARQGAADELDLELELVVVDGTTRISFLQEGRVDLSIASMNHTRARDDAIDFSVTYLWDNQSFLVRTGTYTSLDELIGARVAANAGSSAVPAWNAYIADRDGSAEIVEFDDKLAALQALRDGAVEGYTEDNITLLSLAAGDPGLALIPGGHNPVQFGIGVTENDSGWRDEVNYALQDLWRSGEYETLYDRWFVGPDQAIDLPLGGAIEVWP